ncbi:DUF2753 domain-containing protein [Bartonella sp. HY406]|uniref:DUF2753 domain-containing protein n=1 Tax=Bartonella sp. HY406 TaxID=2979331 RepID=UPI0021C9DBA4|nr:DUF2753 domain-containing protein [Bartonella sp. HY406]UXN04067.1 DUF2753 domain-containing protein [Bartonella sp. HY406]
MGFYTDNIKENFKQECKNTGSDGLRVINGGDQNWQNYTKLANEAFKHGEIEQAVHFYSQAFGEAEILFHAAIAGEGRDTAPMLYNISCHNLAALEMWRNNRLEADYYYYKAYHQLLDIASAVDTFPNLRLACVQHLKFSLIALVDHLVKHQIDKDHIIQLKQDAAKVALNVYHMAEHMLKAKQDCPHCSPH